MDGWMAEDDEIQIIFKINLIILITFLIALLLVGKTLEPIFYKFSVSIL